MHKGFPGPPAAAWSLFVQLLELQTLTGVLFPGEKGLDAGERIQNPLNEFSHCCGLNTWSCWSEPCSHSEFSSWNFVVFLEFHAI